MPQLITKSNSTIHQALPLTTRALIPGLSISALTGAGWLRLRAIGTLVNTYGGANTLSVAIRLDNVDYYNNAGGGLYLPVPQGGCALVSLDIPIRAGAGQHTLEIWGAAANAHMTVDGYGLRVELHELGY